MPPPESLETTEPNAPLPSHGEGGELTELTDRGGASPELVHWNLSALTLDVIFFSLSIAFFDPSTILPQLMERLGATGLMIGVFASIRSLAFNCLQVFVTYATINRERQKPFLAWVATISRLPLLIIPFVIARAEITDQAQNFALWTLVGLSVLWSLGDGLGYVPWMELVARSFSDRTRGRFFTSTQAISGAIGIGIAAFAVSPILQSSRFAYPLNYAILAAIYAVLMQISLLGVLLIKEPPAPASYFERIKKPRPSLATYMLRMPSLTRENPVFARLSLIGLLIGFGTAAQPFYVLYAKSYFGLDDAWGGRYQVFLAVGAVALMPTWTLLSERFGGATAVRGVGIACLLTPLVALTLGRVSPWLFGLVFLLMGGTLGWGLWIVVNQFLLRHIDEGDRSIFVALINLLFAPSALYPTIGGRFVPDKQFLMVAGVPTLFLVTATVIAFGVLLSLRLPNPQITDR
jgi:MFS family permease